MKDTETRLGEAMRTATAGPRESVPFEPLARRVRNRRRRRQALAAAAAAVALTTSLWIVQAGGGGDAPPPSKSPRPTQSEGTRTPARADTSELDPAVVQEPWTAGRWRQLPWSTTGLPRRLDPAATGATSLAADPVGRALAAVQTGGGEPVHLLGEDGRWREQDVVGAEPVEEYDGGSGLPLRPGSLSRDGSRLALPQPGGLIVIDLATNRVHRHELPGRLAQEVVWTPDGGRVLVRAQTDRSHRYASGLVDAATGGWRQVPYDAALTSYAADGTAVEARPADAARFAYDLRRYGPGGAAETVPLAVDLFEDTATRIAAGTGAAAVVRDVVESVVPRPDGSWPGPTVVDIGTGRALGHIPVRGSEALMYGIAPLGWADGDTVLLRLGNRVVAWDYTSGDLRRVTEVAAPARGRGWAVTLASGLTGPAG